MDTVDITDSTEVAAPDNAAAGHRVGDPHAAMAYELLVAIDNEIAALDRVALRSRVSMMLAAAGEFSHLRRSGDDLDEAAEALDAASTARDEVVTKAATMWNTPTTTARDVVQAIPEQFAKDLQRRIDLQRSLLAEVTEAVKVAGDISQRSLEVLAAKRAELEQPGGRSLTYGAGAGVTPPAVVAELA